MKCEIKSFVEAPLPLLPKLALIIELDVLSERTATYKYIHCQMVSPANEVGRRRPQVRRQKLIKASYDN